MPALPAPVCCTVPSPLGPITLAARGPALVGVWFDGQRHFPDLHHWRQDAAHAVLQQAAAQLQEYFTGRRRSFDLPLDWSGASAFAQRVWQQLLRIAPGSTSSYGAISAAIGQPGAVRAVGGAIGRNPLSIVVPCHRVLGARGALTGYAGGLERKVALLQLEALP
ncbi:MAG: methylated-DNA--[protein]-cysteine S-methyltransferase [Rhodoferax sp.]